MEHGPSWEANSCLAGFFGHISTCWKVGSKKTFTLSILDKNNYMTSVHDEQHLIWLDCALCRTCKLDNKQNDHTPIFSQNTEMITANFFAVHIHRAYI